MATSGFLSMESRRNNRKADCGPTGSILIFCSIISCRAKWYPVELTKPMPVSCKYLVKDSLFSWRWLCEASWKHIDGDFHLHSVIHPIFLHYYRASTFRLGKLTGAKSKPSWAFAFTSTDVASQWQLENSECTSGRKTGSALALVFSSFGRCCLTYSASLSITKLAWSGLHALCATRWYPNLTWHRQCHKIQMNRTEQI